MFPVSDHGSLAEEQPPLWAALTNSCRCINGSRLSAEDRWTHFHIRPDYVCYFEFTCLFIKEVTGNIALNRKCFLSACEGLPHINSHDVHPERPTGWTLQDSAGLVERWISDPNPTSRAPSDPPERSQHKQQLMCSIPRRGLFWDTSRQIKQPNMLFQVKSSHFRVRVCPDRSLPIDKPVNAVCLVSLFCLVVTVTTSTPNPKNNKTDVCFLWCKIREGSDWLFVAGTGDDNFLLDNQNYYRRSYLV